MSYGKYCKLHPIATVHLFYAEKLFMENSIYGLN